MVPNLPRKRTKPESKMNMYSPFGLLHPCSDIPGFLFGLREHISESIFCQVRAYYSRILARP